ncbi:UNVERIFIED_CONTAM: hypothetical protein Sradi_4868100 [Sesamum radiatum]|uniref:Uncharacterized protein n=1 Tax=Sesamum radiatum TaxID=300843 RepID=A0AAW2MZ54_SESRA
MADFLWHNKEHRRVHWIAWAKLCTRKENGGLGLRRLHLFNQALAAMAHHHETELLDGPDS